MTRVMIPEPWVAVAGHVATVLVVGIGSGIIQVPTC